MFTLQHQSNSIKNHSLTSAWLVLWINSNHTTWASNEYKHSHMYTYNYHKQDCTVYWGLIPSVCFLSVLKGSGIITPNEEEISGSGMREVQWRGIQCDHLGDIYKIKQLLYTSATYRSLTAHGRHL